ncbi:hypothetical protein AB6B38_02525 [Glycocaulis abyssi]|uniref:Uncharacterized protein n=1 Tax=Glycocaulis abyssi TaxID=1433403 RepID=A0ABV9NAQ1_9PROT
MKGSLIRFFRNKVALALAGLTLAMGAWGVALIGFEIVGGNGSLVWSLINMLASLIPILLLAVVIEYLSRIADALEKPGALGFEDEAGE